MLSWNAKYTKISQCVPEAFADGYLYQTSTACKSIRDTFLNFGYRYSTKPPFPYHAGTFVSLQEILKTRIVPITNNVYWLEKIANEYEFDCTGELASYYVNGSYVIHESAHCIAHHILKGPRKRLGQ